MGYFEGGSLSGTSASNMAQEGQVELIQFYITGSPAPTNNTLGCLSATQTVITCTSAAKPWVGVVNTTNPPSRGPSTAVARAGRAVIASSAMHQYTANDFVCEDTTTFGDVVDGGGTPCPLGQLVGLAVGDNASGTSHLVDLAHVPAAYPTLGTTGGSYAVPFAAEPQAPYQPVLLQRCRSQVVDTGSAITGLADGTAVTGTPGHNAPTTANPEPYVDVPTTTTLHTPAGYSGNLIYRTGITNTAGIFFDLRGSAVQAPLGTPSTTNYNLFAISLTDQTLSALVGDAGSDCKPAGNYVGIWACTGGSYTMPPTNSGTDFVCVANDNSGTGGNANQQSADSTVAFDGKPHKFAMWEDLANSKWHYYLDGTEVCTGIAATHNPASGTNLRYVLGVNNLSTTSEIWTGDAWEIFSF